MQILCKPCCRWKTANSYTLYVWTNQLKKINLRHVSPEVEQVDRSPAVGYSKIPESYQWREPAAAAMRRIPVGGETSSASHTAAGDTERLKKQRETGDGRDRRRRLSVCWDSLQLSGLYLTGRRFLVSASSSSKLVQPDGCDPSWPHLDLWHLLEDKHIQ